MTKINQILSQWVPGDVHTLKWFANRGVGQRTAYAYAEDSSLSRIGEGVFCRVGDSLHWAGAIRAMQEELGFDVHIGSHSALAIHGAAHQIQSGNSIDLITYSKLNLPKWVLSNDWSATIHLRRSSLFKRSLVYEKVEVKGIGIAISSRELAILEFVDQTDLSNSFETLEDQMRGLATLRPAYLQELLESCRSVKVKRVFLYLSEHLQLPFFHKLELKRIDLGSGKRVIAKNGIFNSKYQITVPNTLEENPF